MRNLFPNPLSGGLAVMAKKLYIVLGDKTTHGGTVITAQEMMTIDGKPVATVGCKVTCPKCRGTFSIIEGDPNDTLNGQPIAREGDRTECGAQLLAGGQLRSTHEE
jgi:uncharacterized Zn-binding protein involved in type VI secretion